MKKSLIRLSLAVVMCAVILPSCKKKSSSGTESESSNDTIVKTETSLAVSPMNEGEYDYDAKVMETNGDEVERMIHIIDLMGTEIMKNPSQAEYIAQRFETLGDQINENAPVSVKDIRNLNDAVSKMLAKVIYGSLVYSGVDPQELTAEQDELIENQLSSISDDLAYHTASARTLGEYVWQMAEFLQSLN